MALNAATVWEFRTGGSNDNGGGYRTGASGTDYSQQDSAQLTLSDLATDGAGTGLSSATGGFTAAMIGNIIYIKSGTGFTVGWYEITAHTDTNNVTIDRSAGISATGGTGSVGGARAVPTAAHWTALVAGNIIWMGGAVTYTLTEGIIGSAGTLTNMIKLLGYNSSRGDNPTGANRPTIAAGGNTFLTGNYWEMRNIIGTTTNSSGFRANANCLVQNVKAHNTSGTAGRDGMRVEADTKVLYCEMLCNSTGDAVDTSSRNFFYGCYIHDAANGFRGANDNLKVENCIIDTCTNGSNVTTTPHTYINNIFYNCSTAILIAGNNSFTIINNLFDSCTTGVSASSALDSNYLDYNNWNNNGTDVSNVTKGDHATTDDPSFTDAANGDFSNTLSANAMPKTTFPGGLTDNALVQGAVQPAADGGGGESSHVTIS
jgi:hypothetical protein